jgi:septal ring factor EnvC (AmiA/AmiB activator)
MAPFLFTHLRSMHVTKTSETQSQTEQLESAAPSKPSGRKSILALSVFALGLNATAAVYTMSPSDFALPNVSSLAELLPHQKASDPMLDPVVAALKDIQSAQQQHVASLQENSSSLQQNTALLERDSTTLSSLRESITDEQADVKKISAQITDEHVDVKKMSAQISTLIAKVDSLKNAITPEVTSSIPTGRARNRLSGVVRKRMARRPKPLEPISVGATPLSFPATTPGPHG